MAHTPDDEIVAQDDDKRTRTAVIKALSNAKPRIQAGDDDGLILADAMGLGKTAQGAAAVVLRRAIAIAKTKRTTQTNTYMLSK